MTADLIPITYPEELPIAAAREEIIAAIRAHRVVIVAGDTGSGKSTQLPKMCLEAGQGVTRLIGCTQPRRLAATSVAQRVAEELGGERARLVGCKIRFSDRTTAETRIKFMTDGILLAETRRDRELAAYDTIIIDEAHERSLNIDFLLGILRRLSGAAPRPENNHHLGHHRHRPLCRGLRRGAGDPGGGPRLPGGVALSGPGGGGGRGGWLRRAGGGGGPRSAS